MQAKQAHKVALENNMNMATVEIQYMKSVTQTMAGVVQAVQSMILGNASAGLETQGSVVRGPRIGVKKGSLFGIGR